MLLDKIDQVTEIIITAKESTDLSSKNVRMDTLIKELKGIHKVQKSLIGKKVSLTTHQIKDDTQTNTANHKKSLQELKKRLKDEIPVAQELKGMKHELDQIDKQLDTIWQSYVRTDVRRIESSLRIVQGISTEKERIDKILDGLNVLGRIKFEGERSFDKLNNLVNEGNSIIGDLGLTPSAELFLEKMVKRQATIRDLTPDILDWIKEHDLEDSVKIGF